MITMRWAFNIGIIGMSLFLILANPAPQALGEDAKTVLSGDHERFQRISDTQILSRIDAVELSIENLKHRLDRLDDDVSNLKRNVDDLERKTDRRF